MSELKARTAQSIAQEEEMLELGAPDGIEPELVYLKSEADKVIADLEESHKMEVEQLLIEITNLEKRIKFLQVTAICKDCNKCADGMAKVFDENLNELKEQVHDYGQGLYVMQARAENEVCHHKYKRCLAMAMWCESKVYHIRRTPLCDMSEHEYWQYENVFWQRWQIRWLELAYYLCEGGEVMIYAKGAK